LASLPLLDLVYRLFTDLKIPQHGKVFRNLPSRGKNKIIMLFDYDLFS
jgi:hypothetical protein